MAKAYVSLRDDRFTRAIVGRGSRSLGGNVSNDFKGQVEEYNVRRPLHGMTLPKDSYASMTIVTSRGSTKQLLHNSSLSKEESKQGIKSSYTTNFIVQSVSESKAEKQQIVQTFGDDYVYFYGQQPTMLQVQAILPESEEFMYAQEFWLNYGSGLRGTQLVLNNARMYLTVAGQVFEGYLTTASTSKRADSPRVVNLNFSIYVTQSYYLKALESATGYRSAGGGTETKYHSEVKAGDFIKLPSVGTVGVESEESLSQDNFNQVATNIGFGKFVDDLAIMDLNEDPENPKRISLKEEAPFTISAAQVTDLDLVQSAAPLVQALKSKKKDSVNLVEFFNTALAITAGGLIIAGAVKAISDDYRAYVVGGGRNGFGGYAYNRVVEPAVSAVTGVAEGVASAGDALFDAGYKMVSPKRRAGAGGVSSASGGSSSNEGVDGIVLDI